MPAERHLMKRACCVVSVAVILFATGCSEGRAPTSPSRAAVELAADLQPVSPPSALFGASAVDFARCLQSAGDPACFAGARIQRRAVGAAATAPGAPINLSTSSSGSSVTLTWGAPASGDPLTTYIIEAGSGPGLANLANFTTNSTATSFSASGIGAGTYYVRTRAQNAGGISTASNESILVVGSAGCAAPPNAPSGLVITASGSTVTLGWSAPVGGCPATSYLLQAGSSAGQSNLANSNVGSTTTYVASGVGNGTYYVRVRAANAYGQSAASNEFTLVVGSATPTPTPTPTPGVFALSPHYPSNIDFGFRGSGCSSSNSSRTFTVTTIYPTQSWQVSWTGLSGVNGRFERLVSPQVDRSAGVGPGTFTLLLGFNGQSPSPGGTCSAGFYSPQGGTLYLKADDQIYFDYVTISYQLWLAY